MKGERNSRPNQADVGNGWRECVPDTIFQVDLLRDAVPHHAAPYQDGVCKPKGPDAAEQQRGRRPDRRRKNSNDASREDDAESDDGR